MSLGETVGEVTQDMHAGVTAVCFSAEDPSAAGWWGSSPTFTLARTWGAGHSAQGYHGYVPRCRHKSVVSQLAAGTSYRVARMSKGGGVGYSATAATRNAVRVQSRGRHGQVSVGRC
jgi:hypothetical protein